MIKKEKKVLLNPGPATTTDGVKAAQIVPDICPREKEFANILERLQCDLVKIVHGGDDYSAVLFCGSGTICMDVCLNSLLPENKRILVINNGAYTSRAVEICQHYGLSYIELKFRDDELPVLHEIEDALLKNDDIAVVYTTHNETGTGILNPIREIGALAHKYNCISVIDTTSTYGMIPIDVEADNIDFCMSSAQKGLMAMTGLSYVIGKTRLIIESEKYPKRSYYCNLFMQYEHFIKNKQMHFTPPVQTVYAAVQAMEEYFFEGEKNKFLRHKSVNDAIHNGLKKLGFKEYIKKEQQSGLVISAIYPDDKNWSFNDIHDYCYDRGFTIYPGVIRGTNTFRLCSFGAIDASDIHDFFKTFEAGLKKANVEIPVKYIAG
ncbi:MAG: 2-aminoethylphosphonate aminotransferase [Oscillospiraceae bacterium]|nr:2-aminoethylphosphonate aminotransferase [Oscillospiraceae bacterium]